MRPKKPYAKKSATLQKKKQKKTKKQVTEWFHQSTLSEIVKIL